MQKIVNRIIMLSAALVALYCLSPTLETVKRIGEQVNHKLKVEEIKTSQNRVDHAQYKNEDYIGFLIIEDTNIYYPVVKGEDNDFYLTNDWNKKTSYFGSIFMDYRNSISDEVFTIYGHYTMENNMFSQLTKFEDEEFSPKMYLSFKNGSEVELEAFAFSKIGLEDMKSYNRSESTYEHFKKTSMREYDVNYNEENIVLLSTCASPTSRYVLSTLVKD